MSSSSAGQRDELLQALALVESSPNYRVLRRLVARDVYVEPAEARRIGGGQGPAKLFTGLVLDLETTSPDPMTCEVIEFGAARFTFDATGMIHTITDRYDAFEQPSKPIDPIITEITGITDADVEGQTISTTRVAELASGVDLFVAFNADFDRRIAERRWPGLFEAMPWACAMRQVPWPRYGVIGGKLQHVATAAGYFYDAHRALDDCLATVHLLATMTRECDDCFGFGGSASWWSCVTCRGSGLVAPMREVLSTTRSGAVRVLAHDAPFEYKTSDAVSATVEMDWLRAYVPRCRPTVRRISARDRYSIREDD